MLTEGMFIDDRYEIVGKIGAGGMSDVYKAKDHTLGRFVAIKVLKQEFSEDVNFVTKFRTEAQSAAGLEHPNIVNIYDVGSQEGMYYIIMEYVEGITLKTYIEKKGQLTFKDIQTFSQISGIRHLYPKLDVSFLRELLDSRVYDAKGYSVEDASQFRSLFRLISDAILKHQQIAFMYKGEPRIVEPYKLLHHHGSWYLAAVRKGELRAYRLSRIELSAHSHELSSFKPQQSIFSQLEDEESIWFGQEKHEIVLTVHADVASHFQQRALLPEQQVIKRLDDGGLLLSSRITHTTQILPLVRYWIPHLKIVNPEGLQVEVERELKNYISFNHIQVEK